MVWFYSAICLVSFVLASVSAVSLSAGSLLISCIGLLLALAYCFECISKVRSLLELLFVLSGALTPLLGLVGVSLPYVWCPLF